MTTTYLHWTYDVERVCLVGPHGYEVDLDTCRTSAEVLDWICQVAGKEWGTPEVTGELAKVLNELLHPQATLCTGGRECGPINPRAVLADVAGLRG